MSNYQGLNRLTVACLFSFFLGGGLILLKISML